jgi:5-methyltetrahydropteroyltriglutamate--homocysteine methyltransferase
MAFIISGKFIALFNFTCHPTLVPSNGGPPWHARISSAFRAFGARRELKFALEAFWRGELIETELQEVGRALRKQHAQLQLEAGLDLICAGEFTTTTPFSTTRCSSARFRSASGFDPRKLPLTQYFELARGNAAQPALEMTKWFDTNYHYLVPELGPEHANSTAASIGISST